MPGRITCAECTKYKVHECKDCKKPGGRDLKGIFFHGLDQGNIRAFEIWDLSKLDSSRLGVIVPDYLSYTERFGGSQEDFEKVVEIDTIFNKLNGKKRT